MRRVSSFPANEPLLGLIAVIVLAIASLQAAPAALAQEAFSDADLAGRFAFELRFDVRDNLLGHATSASSFAFVGVLVADGEGGVTGRRWWHRSRSPRNNPDPFALDVEIVEQAITGTYSVEPDGMGVMRLTVDPAPPWVEVLEREEIVFGAEEEVRFVLSRGSCELLLVAVHEATRRRIHVSPPEPVYGGSLHSNGHAWSQDAACASGGAAGTFPPGRGVAVGIGERRWER